MNYVIDRLRPNLKTAHAYRVQDTMEGVQLHANESPWPLCAQTQEKIAQIVKTLSFHRYPDSTSQKLKSTLSNLLDCPENELLLGNGSDEIISIINNAFGLGYVIYPTPTFSMYKNIANTHGLTPIGIPLDKDWNLDPIQMKQAIERYNPVLCYYAVPNNPTGQCIPHDVLIQCIESTPHTLHIIDEAYIYFAKEYNSVSCAKDNNSKISCVFDTSNNWTKHYRNVAVLGTLSKIGLAGLRIGWVKATADLICEFDKVRLPFNINIVSQTIARYILKHEQHTLATQVQTIISERKRIEKTLLHHSKVKKIWPSHANFLLIKPTSKRIIKNLQEKNIFFRQFDHPALEGCLRITIGTPQENNMFLHALENA